MSSYRELLYKDYSASFAAQKRHDPAVQHSLYEATYHRLPENHAARVLDLGCGRGEWLGWLGTKGYTHLTGVDGSAADLALARAQGAATEWLESDALAILATAPTASFDLIHAKDVIEHFTKDEFVQLLQSARRTLRPGGQLWMLTFNAQSPLSTATRYGDFTHETGHTPASLAQCLRACGFEKISVQGRHYCSASLGGRVRGLLGFGYYRLARILLKLRHGSGARSHDVDTHTALPDLFACAFKPL